MEREVTVTEAELNEAEERGLISKSARIAVLDWIVFKRKAAAKERAAGQRATVKAAVEFYKKAMEEGGKA